MDHIVPLEVKLNNVQEPDLNRTFDNRHIALKQNKHENAFKEFVRRGKEMLFDQYFDYLADNIDANRDVLDYLLHVNSSTEDKFEFVIEKAMTEKEIDNYFHQCWKYNYVVKSPEENGKELVDSTNTISPTKEVVPVTVHTPWCLVCGQGERLRDCVNCPAAFHVLCRHRKNPPKKVPKPVTVVDKILSSTRTKSTVGQENENMELCPSCMWGPKVGYDDIVWYKLAKCPWWPARILTPGNIPPCLVARNHSQNDWPLRYYGTLNHSWGAPSRACLFLPSHTGALAAKDSEVKDAVMDANDDYISVYLT